MLDIYFDSIKAINMGVLPKIVKSINNLVGLTEQEKFILSFIDGKTSSKEISRVTGLSLSTVNKILDQLMSQKVIVFQQSASFPISSEQKLTGHSLRDLYNIYENADPYTILGINEHATLEEIKNAYIEKTKIFHPDSYYARTIPVEDKQILAELYKKIQQAFQALKDKSSVSQSTQKQNIQAQDEQATVMVKKEQSPKDVSVKDKLEDTIKQRVKKASDYYKLGMDAFIKNDYSTAYLNFKLANSYNPYERQYTERMKEAESLMKVSRYEDLIKKADASIELNKPDDALNYLKSAVELTNDKKFLYYRIASVMYDFNHSLKEAKNYCEQAIKLDPKNPDFHLLLARIYKKGGLLKSSMVEFKQAFSLGARTDEVKTEMKQLKALIK